MQTIFLAGSEEVSRAGVNMQSAAREMGSAASSIDHSLAMHRQWMDDWLIRFSDVIDRLKEK